MTSGITAVIPVHTPRLSDGVLDRALHSVNTQTHPVHAINVAVDHDHVGAGPTRTRAMAAVSTKWLAFLDSDDEWYPQHLERLLACADEHEADVVYPWFDVRNPDGRPGFDPFPQFEGKPWNPDEPHLFPICALVRTEMVQGLEFPAFRPDDPAWDGDDWPFWLSVFERGAKVVHLNERTWRWNHWGISSPQRPIGNTSGRGDRW